MTVTITAGRIPGAHRRLRPAGTKILRDWSVKHVRNLKRAYLEGGHQRRGGKPWKPVKRKRPPPTLIRTGAMRRATSADPIGTRVTFFNTATYAAYHQFGTGTIPKREVLVVTRRDEKELRRRLVLGLERALR